MLRKLDYVDFSSLECRKECLLPFTSEPFVFQPIISKYLKIKMQKL
jgi:hypothetical protein